MFKLSPKLHFFNILNGKFWMNHHPFQSYNKLLQPLDDNFIQDESKDILFFSIKEHITEDCTHLILTNKIYFCASFSRPGLEFMCYTHRMANRARSVRYYSAQLPGNVSLLSPCHELGFVTQAQFGNGMGRGLAPFFSALGFLMFFFFF